MRTLRVITLLALCVTLFAGCAAENDPMGVSSLPTDQGVGLQSDIGCCIEGCDAECAEDVTCERSCAQDIR